METTSSWVIKVIWRNVGKHALYIARSNNNIYLSMQWSVCDWHYSDSHLVHHFISTTELA